MAYCCAVRGGRESTVVAKPVAVKFFHEQWMGRSLTLNHFWIKIRKRRDKERARGRRYPTTDDKADTPRDKEDAILASDPFCEGTQNRENTTSLNLHEHVTALGDTA